MTYHRMVLVFLLLSKNLIYSEHSLSVLSGCSVVVNVFSSLYIVLMFSDVLWFIREMSGSQPQMQKRRNKNRCVRLVVGKADGYVALEFQKVLDDATLC